MNNRGTMTFMERFMRGEVALDEVDDYVELWHEGMGYDLALHEYLGLTWDEYGLWASKPSMLNEIRRRRLAQV